MSPPFAPGSLVVSDGTQPCLPVGTYLVYVRHLRHQPYLRCEKGHHLLDTPEHRAGLRLAPEPPATDVPAPSHLSVLEES